MPLHQTTYTTPIGDLLIESDGAAITKLIFVDEPVKVKTSNDALLKQAVYQLDKYFIGELKRFHLPLSPAGTEFQQRVWQQLQQIPFGRSTSYHQLATHLGDVKAIRAVGTANGRNPIAIVIPCHRVIGSDGSLTGYAGGLHRKKWLLQHEGVLARELF